MKRLIVLISAIVILFTMSVSVFAGDIPETLLDEYGAKVFIGVVEDCKLKGEVSFSSKAEIDTIEVIPTEKIKGEVEIGKKETYTRCDSVIALEKGKEYLFGYIDEDNFYIYEIKSRDEKTIKLVDSDKYDMVLRLENYLSEGAFAMAEQERSTLGKQISFAEFLYQKPSLSSSGVKKVTLRYQDELHEVDKDKFFEIAEDIMITGSKNEMLYETRTDSKTPEPYKTVLYIELLDAYDKVAYYGAVSRFGEVDRYGLFMSRLMQKDYEMRKEDLSKLYSLLPTDVQSEIKLPEQLPDGDTLQLTDEIVRDYKGIAVGGVVIIFAIAFAMGFVIIKKKQK